MLVEAFALAELGDAKRGHVRGKRVANPEPFGDARRDRDRPVDARRDDAVDPFGLGERRDRRLVLGRDDGAPVCVLEAERLRVAVAGDDEDVALTRGAEQTELSRARA